MIINFDEKPDDCIYYISGEILSILKGKTYGTMELYHEYTKKRKVAFNLFLLSLDWLQLIDAIFFSQKGFCLK